MKENRTVENMIKDNIGCFIRGTQVHTDSPVNNGLKPIEELQVGDRVLCKPELGAGEATYKRVTKTFKFEQKEIWYVGTEPLQHWIEHEDGRIEISEISGSGSSLNLGVTANHPFWLVGQTNWHGSIEEYIPLSQPHWVRVDQIPPFGVVTDYKGRLHVVKIARPFYKMDGSSLAWLQGGSTDKDWRAEPYGDVFDLYKRKRFYSSFEIVSSEVPNGYLDEYESYLDTVYNIELDDYSTYFIGLTGVWVHT